MFESDDSPSELKVAIVFRTLEGTEYQLGTYFGPLGVAEKQFNSTVDPTNEDVKVSSGLQAHSIKFLCDDFGCTAILLLIYP